MEKYAIGGECSTYGRGEAYTGFWWGNLRERDHLKDPGVDGKIIIRWIFRKLDKEERKGSICLGWRALVNEIMNLRVA